MDLNDHEMGIGGTPAFVYVCKAVLEHDLQANTGAEGELEVGAGCRILIDFQKLTISFTGSSTHLLKFSTVVIFSSLDS